MNLNDKLRPECAAGDEVSFGILFHLQKKLLQGTRDENSNGWLRMETTYEFLVGVRLANLVEDALHRRH